VFLVSDTTLFLDAGILYGFGFLLVFENALFLCMFCVRFGSSGLLFVTVGLCCGVVIVDCSSRSAYVVGFLLRLCVIVCCDSVLAGLLVFVSVNFGGVCG